MKISKYIIFTALLGSLTGCYSLDRDPMGEISSSTAFGSAAEIQKYVNGFYTDATRRHGGGYGVVDGIAFTDLNSDNMAGEAVNTRLAGEFAISSAAKLKNYEYIRNLNVLLTNLDNCETKDSEYYQYVGEAYYFRAWFYYQMFINYGGLAIVTEDLDPTLEATSLPRNSRMETANFILDDLDKAIEYLKPATNSASMRVHQDVAYALKSEVALFEGTWEKYHKADNTPFFDSAVSDADIKNYLEQSRDAAKAVIDKGVWGIDMGSDVYTAYRDLFISLDLSTNKEVLWWKKYDVLLSVGHSVTRYANEGGSQSGPTQSLVDDYLKVDGTPFVDADRAQYQSVYGEELSPSLRDPRLAQTVCTPGTILKTHSPLTFTVPPLDGASFDKNTTGFSMYKYIEFNPELADTEEGDGKSQAAAIQFRYADILLNYAEALAELDGAGNATAIATAIKPLRDRVGMPAVDFDREYNTESTYPFKGLDKYIQAVRRERRVEKALEGRRLEDILRWAAADELIVGKKPYGALYVGSNLESAYSTDLMSLGAVAVETAAGASKGHILPYSGYTSGWQFDVKRDYLQPFQLSMISLTNNIWEQNPNW